MAQKEQFRKAIGVLRIATSVLPAEGKKFAGDALETVERFAGSLRREKSALKRENETYRNHLATLKERIGKEKSELASLDRRKREQRSEYERLLMQAYEEGIRLPGAKVPGAEFSVIKAKCLACSLHFLVCTDSPERHSSETLYCPECGQHDGGFLVWSDKVNGFIFELVPGRSEPTGHPNLDVLKSSLADEPKPVIRCVTLIPQGIDVEPEVMAEALRNLYVRFHERHAGQPPTGTMIYEDFSKDGNVLFFAFALHTGGGSSVDGCAVPDPAKSRAEQVRDLVNGSLDLGLEIEG
jgi:hypothetical protein